MAMDHLCLVQSSHPQSLSCLKHHGFSLRVWVGQKLIFSLGQVNIFTPVCHSVHRGGLASQHALGNGGLASQHALGRGVGFPVCTGEGEWGWLPSMHWEKRAVCILLECFLVSKSILKSQLRILYIEITMQRVIFASSGFWSWHAAIQPMMGS